MKITPVAQIPGLAPEKKKRSHSGRRADLDNRYFRSCWEANIARVLNFLVAIKAVESWEYETQEFEFKPMPERKLKGITRGNRFYKIDFKVKWVKDTEPEYWEVKGYLDSDSKTKLNRMARYYPEIKIVVIGRKEYAAFRRQYRGVIPNWEDGTQQAQFRRAS